MPERPPFPAPGAIPPSLDHWLRAWLDSWGSHIPAPAYAELALLLGDPPVARAVAPAEEAHALVLHALGGFVLTGDLAALTHTLGAVLGCPPDDPRFAQAVTLLSTVAGSLYQVVEYLLYPPGAAQDAPGRPTPAS